MAQLAEDEKIEALTLYRQRQQIRLDEVLRCARIYRVEKVMRPYLEVLL